MIVGKKCKEDKSRRKMLDLKKRWKKLPEETVTGREPAGKTDHRKPLTKLI